jgi:chromosome segregation ATPase
MSLSEETPELQRTEQRLTALESAVTGLRLELERLRESLEGEMEMRTRIDDRLSERLDVAITRAGRDYETLRSEIYHVERAAESAQRAADNAQRAAESAASRAGGRW